MKRACLEALVVIAFGACSKPETPRVDVGRLDTGRLGAVHMHEPRGETSGLVFLFSSSSRWSADDERGAAALAGKGAIVVGVDLADYRRALDASDGECLYLLSEIESLSQQVQRAAGLTNYFSPILTGSSEAGALVEAVLAQSPAATVAGAVSVDPTAVVATRLPLCPGAPSTSSGNGFRYGTISVLPGFWSVGFTNNADPDGIGHARALVASGTPGTIETENEPRAATDVLVDLAAEHLEPAHRSSPRLPLVELPAREPKGVLAIVLSGDGGWRDLDKTVAETLRDRGVSVVGWDSLRYFWRKRTPDELARDLASVALRYTREWNTQVTVLIGYSFGADVLPFAYNRLSNEERSSIVQISLLGFSHSADFVVHVAAWLGAGPSAQAVATASETERMPPKIIQCFYGREEADTACPDLGERGAEVIVTAGGHHFDGNYQALATRILEGLAARAPAL